MRSSYRFPVGDSECDLTWWMVGVRWVDRAGVRTALSHRCGGGQAAGYAATTRTSSSVIPPSTIRYERNWKGPASSVSAVETST